MTLQIVQTSLPAASAGHPYGAFLSTTGGTAPVRWELAGGVLPCGIYLTSDGRLQGSASWIGTSPSFTVCAIDSSLDAAGRPLPQRTVAEFQVTAA